MVVENIDLSGFLSWFESIGGFDVILPFLLIFAISFAILDKVKLLGDKKNINVIVSIILAFFLVLQQDLVFVIQGFLPRVSMLILSLIMVLLVVGSFGFPVGESWRGLSVIIAIIGVLWALGASLNWNVPALDYFTDQDIAVLLIIGIFFLVIWFIVKEPRTPEGAGIGGKIGDFLKGFAGGGANK